MNNKLKEYRNYFNNFKKSLEYKELQSYLLKKQSYIYIYIYVLNVNNK